MYADQKYAITLLCSCLTSQYIVCMKHRCTPPNEPGEPVNSTRFLNQTKPNQKNLRFFSLLFLISALTYPAVSQVVIRDSISITPNSKQTSARSTAAPEWMRVYFDLNISQVPSGGRVFFTVAQKETLIMRMEGVLNYYDAWPPVLQGKQWSVEYSNYYPSLSGTVTYNSLPANPGELFRTEVRVFGSNVNVSLGVVVGVPYNIPPPSIHVEYLSDDPNNPYGPLIVTPTSLPTVTFSETHTPMPGDDQKVGEEWNPGSEPVVTWNRPPIVSSAEFYDPNTNEFIIPQDAESYVRFTGLDEIEVTLEARASNEYGEGVGGQSVRFQRAPPITPVDHFQVTVIPNVISHNDTSTIYIQAKDSDNNDIDFPYWEQLSIGVDSTDYGHFAILENMIGRSLDGTGKDVYRKIQALRKGKNIRDVNYSAPEDSMFSFMYFNSIVGGLIYIADGKNIDSQFTALFTIKQPTMNVTNGVGSIVLNPELSLDHFSITVDKDTLSNRDISIVTVIAVDKYEIEYPLDGPSLLELSFQGEDQYIDLISPFGDTVNILQNIPYESLRAGLVKIIARGTSEFPVSTVSKHPIIGKQNNPSSIEQTFRTDFPNVQLKTVLAVDATKTGIKKVVMKPELKVFVTADSIKPLYPHNIDIEESRTEVKIALTVSGLLYSGPPYGISISSKAIENSGGHSHNINRPTGRFIEGNQELLVEQKQTTGDTIRVMYQSSLFGGKEKITVKLNDITPTISDSDSVVVRVQNLVNLPEGDNYELIGERPEHNENHWVDPIVRDYLIQLAQDYVEEFEPEHVIKYNDISLEFGGGFDVGHRWENDLAPRATGHQLHRIGKSVDIRANPHNNDGVSIFEKDKLELLIHSFAPMARVSIHSKDRVNADGTVTINPNQHFHIDF